MHYFRKSKFEILNVIFSVLTGSVSCEKFISQQLENAFVQLHLNIGTSEPHANLKVVE